jgi:hypothetical protein
MSDIRPARPPWQILTVVGVLVLLMAFLVSLLVADVAGGTTALGGWLFVIAVVLVLGLIAAGLWQGRPAARIAGFVIGGLLLLVGALTVLTGSATFLEPLSGVAIVWLLATRPARMWTSLP